MSKSGQALGRWGEMQAETFLIEKGLRFITRNFRSEFGEIDLVFGDGKSLVFVEVKTRKGKKFGFPEEAVNIKKQKHLIESAQSFLQENIEGELDWRIDVIAILKRENGKFDIEHFEDALR